MTLKSTILVLHLFIFILNICICSNLCNTIDAGMVVYRLSSVCVRLCGRLSKCEYMYVFMYVHVGVYMYVFVTWP